MRRDSNVTLLLPTVFLALASFCSPAHAYSLDSTLTFRYAQPIRFGLLLPMTGPEASMTNPARLAEADRGFSLIGSEKGGQVSTSALEAGLGIKRTVYLGLGIAYTGSKLPGSNAVFLEANYQFMIAYRRQLGSGGNDFWSIGYASLYH